MTPPQHPDPVIAACMARWSVPAESIKVRWLEEEVAFTARAKREGERVSAVGALSAQSVTFGAEAAQEALLAHWQDHRPTATEAADALSTAVGLDSVHRVTERMPAELYPPREAELEGVAAVEFWAVSDGETQRYHHFTVRFPDGQPAAVERQRR